MSASVVSARSLTARQASLIAAIASFTGSLLLGSAVARTFGEHLIRLDLLPHGTNPFEACIAAALAALGWATAAWRLGLPGSYTHALLGGWLGAFFALGGASVVQWRNAGFVMVGVMLTPLIGLGIAMGSIRLLYWMVDDFSRKTLPLFRITEIFMFGALSLAHGANAAQKSMALLVVAGFSISATGVPDNFSLPLWIRLVCSAAFAFGVLLGFTRTLKKMGFEIFRVDTLHSFTALAVSGSLVFVSTVMGLPLSPGQINSSSLLGAGAGHNPRKVRWGVVGEMMMNWFLTFPAAAALAWILVKVI
ncbi:MAG: hypothetical protein COB53_10235 [Elusimicrobia bacterium]|nr:MAG: hypothetical protein COB53_10235 [Elusimicrobiota bacterium]